MLLTVRSAAKDDVFADIVRINEEHRKDKSGNRIPAGTICKIEVNGLIAYAILRGKSGDESPSIYLDEYLRDKLKLKLGTSAGIEFSRVGFVGQAIWSWQAVDPAYRVASRLGIISFALGIIGLFLGLLSLKSCS